MNRSGIATVCTLVIFCATPIFAATYYVSPNGNDSSNGTAPTSAWKTLARISSATFKPMDHILLERGGSWNEGLKLGSSGADGKPITLGTYGSGNKPVILQETHVELYGNYIVLDGVTLKGRAFVDFYGNFDIVQNCLFDAVNPAQDGAALFRRGSHDNTVRFCTITLERSSGGTPFIFDGKERFPNTKWYGCVIQMPHGEWIAQSVNPLDTVGTDYNCYKTPTGAEPYFNYGHMAFSGWQKQGMDRHSMRADPKFTDPAHGDYSLANGSPAIDAARGVDAGSVPPKDINGGVRPTGNGPDMGAFEYGASKTMSIVLAAPLPNATVGTDYSQTLTVSGGSGTYTWSVKGALPAGMTLSADGVLGGTPTQSGTFSFAVQVTDSAKATARKALTLKVDNATPAPKS